MKLRYKARDGYYGYDINSRNILYYKHWVFELPEGLYKDGVFGLYFSKLWEEVENQQLGVKIEYFEKEYLSYEIEI
jgi:hypothetical protein